VKTGGVKFTLSKTRTATAETNLAKSEAELSGLQKAGADAAEIQKAEQSVTQARQAQQAALENEARIETARMNFWSRTNFLLDTDTAGLSTRQVQARVAETTNDLNRARAQATDAALTLKEALASGNQGLISEAKANNTLAQKTLTRATQQHLDMLKAERIKQLKAMHYAERGKNRVQDQWATLQDSLGTVRGKTLTSADGRTLNYWRRTPQNPTTKAWDVQTADATTGKQNGSFQRGWSTTNAPENPPASPVDSTADAVKQAEGQQAPGFSMPKGADPNLQNMDTPNGQNNRNAAQSARAAKDAVVAKWRNWRQHHPLQRVSDTAWNNQMNILVPLSEINHRKTKRHDDAEIDENLAETIILPMDLSSPIRQFHVEFPA